jgi:3-deoxy-D-arabino-heptulosonate 7-phosphate (DAHP) synthase
MSQTNFTTTKKLPSEDGIILHTHSPTFCKNQINLDRTEINAIFENNNKHLLMIVGPTDIDLNGLSITD